MGALVLHLQDPTFMYVLHIRNEVMNEDHVSLLVYGLTDTCFKLQNGFP
jgi:hypothetical protein